MVCLFVLFSECLCYPALLRFLTSIFTVCSCHPALLCCHLVLLCASVIQLPCSLLSSNFTVLVSSGFGACCRCVPLASTADKCGSWGSTPQPVPGHYGTLPPHEYYVSLTLSSLRVALAAVAAHSCFQISHWLIVSEQFTVCSKRES